MNEATPSAGDPIPSDCVQIEVHVAELRQLFNAMDPSPFRERDINQKPKSSSRDGRRKHLAIHNSRYLYISTAPPVCPMKRWHCAKRSTSSSASARRSRDAGCVNCSAADESVCSLGWWRWRHCSPWAI